MKMYTLKLKTTSTTNYNLYDGTTLVSDTDLGTLFGSAGEAYFTFDFNSLTPTDTTSLTILNSQDTAVITNTGLSGIAEDKNFKGTWGASATAFTSFELLKGMTMDEAQLGTLVGMIKNGGIKTLTTADYNYPTNSPTRVALNLMPTGIYQWDSSVDVYFAGGENAARKLQGCAIVMKRASNEVRIIAPNTEENGLAIAVTRVNSDQVVSRFYTQAIESLTYSYDNERALSAKSGAVLNNNIGDLSTLTTTAKTSAVAAINELANKEGIKTFTKDDYNYPTDNPTTVALWKLDTGIYKYPGNVSYQRDVNSQASSESDALTGIIIISAQGSSFGNRLVTIFEQYNISEYCVNSNTGTIYGITQYLDYPNAKGKILNSAHVIDNLTSTNSFVPLSAAQGKYLNEKIVGTTETKTIATTDWTALSSSDPYDYSATITATASINASTGVVELLNDQPVLFGTHGFAIGAVSGQSVTIYSIGQPDASVSLKLNIRNL